MKTFLSAMREVWGLFVEDATFTLGIIVCLTLAAFALPHIPMDPSWRGPILFALLAAVLIENVARSARG